MSELTQRDSEPEMPELDANEELRLRELLRHAFRPTEIDPTRHERLLLAALEDPFAEASPEELVESARLREALEGQADHPDLRLARALSAAFAPRVDQPLPEPEVARATPQKQAGQVIFYRFAAVATALALAAAVLLRLTPERHQSRAPVPDLATLA